MIENLGPQLVQLIKEYKYLRSFGFNISFRQSSHTAMSGRIMVETSSTSWLFLISNFEYPRGSRKECSRLVMIERLGLSVSILERKFLRRSSSPSASIITPLELFST